MRLNDVFLLFVFLTYYFVDVVQNQFHMHTKNKYATNGAHLVPIGIHKYAPMGHRIIFHGIHDGITFLFELKDRGSCCFAIALYTDLFLLFNFVLVIIIMQTITVVQLYMYLLVVTYAFCVVVVAYPLDVQTICKNNEKYHVIAILYVETY